jgi:(2R)-3-sulfolactate dehydrogenase (NADP+)
VGQVVLAIDPTVGAGDCFLDRLEHEFTALAAEPGVRLPGDRRIAERAAAEGAGIDVPDDLADLLDSYGGLVPRGGPHR